MMPARNRRNDEFRYSLFELFAVVEVVDERVNHVALELSPIG